jgi:biopolymer transport protein ExbD
MRSSIIAAALLGFVNSPVFAEATVAELTERVEKLEKTVETLVGGMSFFNDDLKLKAAVPGEPDHDAEAEGEAVISVKADGSFQLGDKQLALEELQAELTKLAEQGKEQPVRIRADAAVEYQRVVEVVDACQKAGLRGVSFATKQPVHESGHEACEDKLVATAEIVRDLNDKFFETVSTGRQPWILEDADGNLEDTMDGNIEANDLVLIEQTANCVSSHQGEHTMDHCDAVKAGDGVEMELSGGAPAFMSSLSVTVDAKRQFVCRFKAVYLSPDSAVHWKVTKKAMKLKAAPGEPGRRLRGWISVEFDEIDDATGEAKSYKIEGYFKPVIQSPASEMEEDK